MPPREARQKEGSDVQFAVGVAGHGDFGMQIALRYAEIGEMPCVYGIRDMAIFLGAGYDTTAFRQDLVLRYLSKLA